MKIGIEADQAEELERSLFLAISIAFKAEFLGQGDAETELRRVQDLSEKILNLEGHKEAAAA